jgi:hypothetical protein
VTVVEGGGGGGGVSGSSNLHARECLHSVMGQAQ